MVVPFLVQILAFYRQNPHEENLGKIGGANALPNSTTKPRKHGFGRVSAARMVRWPHPGGTGRRFDVFVLSLAGFSVCVRDFDETSFNLQL